MKVRYTAEANANIARFLRPKSRSGLSDVRTDSRATILRIAENPLSGRTQEDDGVRKAVTKRYGYLIYYTVFTEENAIDVPTIQHPSRDRHYADS